MNGRGLFPNETQIKSFLKKWAEKWRNSGYSWEKFVAKNQLWLDDKPFNKLCDENVSEPGPSKRKCFADLSTSQKNRVTKGNRSARV